MSRELDILAKEFQRKPVTVMRGRLICISPTCREKLLVS